MLRGGQQQNARDLLGRYIRYCLDYVKLTRSAIVRQRETDVPLTSDFFDLDSLLGNTPDDPEGVEVTLQDYYSFLPEDVPAETRNIWERQKGLARKLEVLYNDQRNYEFTRQLLLNFGGFEVELPPEREDAEAEREPLEGTPAAPPAA